MKYIMTMAIVAFVAMTAKAEMQAPSAANSTAASKATTVAKKKKKKKKKSKKEESEGVVSTGTGASSVAEKATISDSTSATAVGSQTYQTKGSLLQTIRKNTGLTFSQATYGGAYGSKNVNTLNGTETDMGVMVDYKINDTTSAQLYNEWDRLGDYDNPYYGGRSDSHVYFQDPFLGVTKTGVVKNDSGFSVDTMARLYAPMSLDSQNAGLATQFRLYGVASQEITKKLTASLTLSPRWYLGTHSSFQDVVTNGTFNGDNFRLLSDFGLKYSFSDKFSVQQILGMYQMWFKGASLNASKAYANFLDASTSLIYSPTKSIDIEAGIRQAAWSTDLTGGSAEGNKNGLYSKGQTEYFVSTALSL